ncbi:MAG: NfeD family protein [Phycisphaerales bacterium]|nr:NfeD family protein [Phycisphaerales bacterium]
MDLFFDGNAIWFGIPALVGTGIFILRLIMMFAGFLDLDVDLDTDVDGAIDSTELLDSDDAFRLFSLQTIAAFLMGFGWGGLVGLVTLDQSVGVSLAIGAGAGVGFVWLLTWLMQAVYALQSSGNVAIGDAAGRTGDVYVTVPGRGSGSGQVRVTIEERQRLFKAVTEGDEIPSHTRIRVTRVNDDNTVTVVPA